MAKDGLSRLGGAALDNHSLSSKGNTSIGSLGSRYKDDPVEGPKRSIQATARPKLVLSLAETSPIWVKEMDQEDLIIFD